MVRTIRISLSIVVCSLLLYAGVRFVQLNRTLYDAEQTLDELNSTVISLSTENAQLQYALEHADDPEETIQSAREQLEYILPNETVYITDP